MKNALNYYYNLYPTSIHQINDSYKCYVNNEEYLLTPCDNDTSNIIEKHELSKYLFKINIPCHQFIQNKEGKILTVINNTNYILLQIFIKNRAIQINDILLFSSIYVDKQFFPTLLKNNWYDMWTKKIDYIEYQVSQFSIKYQVIRDSINYYIGLAENSISLFATTNINEDLVISHQRIKNSDGLIELYNPLNFIIDNKVRDLSEYIKEKFFFYKYSVEEAINDIYKFNLNSNQYILLFIRLLFPSYYFDCYERVLLENKNEQELIKIISKNTQYMLFLKELYKFIKTVSKIPDIEWLMKT